MFSTAKNEGRLALVVVLIILEGRYNARLLLFSLFRVLLLFVCCVKQRPLVSDGAQSSSTHHFPNFGPLTIILLVSLDLLEEAVVIFAHKVADARLSESLDAAQGLSAHMHVGEFEHHHRVMKFYVCD